MIDFFCVEHQIAIELDGAVHETPEQAKLDAARTEALRDQHIQVLRFKNDEIEEHLEDALRRIHEATILPNA